MRNALRFLFLALLFSTAAADAPEVFRQVRINVPDRETLGRVLQAGIDPCGITGRVGGWMEFVAGAHELEELTGRRIPFEVVVEDLAAHYERRMSQGPVNALGFGYGSMGGFYTLAEVYQQLDSMALLYPSLISARDSIGRSVEGRTIWAVRISDNPAVEEPEEPEVLYTALHHAREPQGMMSVIYYMWWLLQNYATDPDAAYLVNNRQMWFIPVMNVDGYFWNQSTNPSGGGMWRKNRRNNGSSYGVDLNRNYGPVYMWNSSNGGSSTSPSSDTYRGTSAFSEPETQAIDAFVRGHNFKAALNYHTYSNLLIYPWGYLSRESADSVLFRDWSYDMTRVNRYTMGTDLQTVAYATRGNSDDYLYGDSTKPRVYALTPEVGATGFWPTSGEIFPLAIENLSSNKFLAFVAGAFPALRSAEVLEADSNGSLTAGESFVLNAGIRNRGLGTAPDLSMTASADVPWLTFAPPTVNVPTLGPQAETQVFFDGVVDSTAPAAGLVTVFLVATDPGGLQKRDTVRLFVGTPALLFADSAQGGTVHWSTGTGWGTTAQAHTPPLAFTDSPSGNYAANANNALTMTGTVNLGIYQLARLRFWTRWAVEPTWDFATVEISTNSGSTWSVLRTELSVRGSARSGSQQPAGSFGYDGYTPGLTWTEQSADLSAYAGRQIRIRFRLAADSGEERDGIFLDDIRIYAYTTTVPPAAPVQHSPADGTLHVPFAVVLGWQAAPGAAAYQVQVSADSLFSTFVVNDSTVAGTHRSVASLAGGTTFFWRVRARNAGGAGPFSPSWRFTTLATISRSYPLTQFWNLLSLPIVVPDSRLSAVFPGASSGAFHFQPALGYVSSETLAPGTGYWVKFDTAGTASMTGLEFPADTVSVLAGWNLIGVIGEAMDTADVVQVPPGILETPFLTFDGGYLTSDSLRPAHGYWVKAGRQGSLILYVGGGAAAMRGDGRQRSRVER